MIVYKEFSSLVTDLGFSAKALYAASNHADKHYHKVKIPKGNGGERVLSVPDTFLKSIQQKITETLLIHEEISEYATAYRYGASTLKNAVLHIGCTSMLKLDIKHFFDNIIYPVVKEKAFPSYKYSESNRLLLALICMYKESLPQGAPTSPAISNIIMKDFDNAVGDWCEKRHIKYTRYCDDMTFSGNINPNEVIALVSNELGKMGLFLNDKKTVFARNGQKKIVTGIVVNEKANIPISYRKEVRQSIYYCRKYGIAEHLKHIGIDENELSYLRRLLGKINYVLYVNSANSEMREYKEWALNEFGKLNSLHNVINT